MLDLKLSLCSFLLFLCGLEYFRYVSTEVENKSGTPAPGTPRPYSDGFVELARDTDFLFLMGKDDSFSNQLIHPTSGNWFEELQNNYGRDGKTM